LAGQGSAAVLDKTDFIDYPLWKQPNFEPSMRPALLYNLFADLKNIKGVGPKRYQAYQRLGCNVVRDLIFHYPNNVLDRRASPSLAVAHDGQLATLIVKIERHITPSSRRMPHKIICNNETGKITLVYFNGAEIIKNKYPAGQSVVISGKIDRQFDGLQMTHPDIIAPAAEYEKVRSLEPIYPLTYSLNNRYLSDTIRNMVKFMPKLPEWLPEEVIVKFKFPSWHQALHQLHHPQHSNDVSGTTPAKDRLAFDELLAQQLSLRIARKNAFKKPKTPLVFNGTLLNQLKGLLPFTLTDDQTSALQEISAEQLSPQRMVRLLQGDVGSGKTLVAFGAILNAIEAGGQAALMAPTEILARQHYSTLQALSEKLGITCHLLIGKGSTSERNNALAATEDGTAQLVIGTHALMQDRVTFNNLALVVIDEQHRFGVEQRQSLLNKGIESDLLLMSATPIPRTLSMVSYGDLDITIIRHKPKSRKSITTKLVPGNRLDETIERLQTAVSEGVKAYWLCPLIEESEKSNLINVTARYDYLSKLMPGKVGLLHGQMKADLKNEVMQSFIAGELQIIVATTVIEVGVDVPDATVMIIENAEHFGLSQLHQLRGRVGRGELQSSCILLYNQPIGQVSYERLKVMRGSEDGFEIAQKDLDMRGSGEVLGTKQSGLPDFKNFDFWQQQHLISVTNQLASEIIDQDPALESPKYQQLQILLHLYDHDKSLMYLGG